MNDQRHVHFDPYGGPGPGRGTLLTRSLLALGGVVVVVVVVVAAVLLTRG